MPTNLENNISLYKIFINQYGGNPVGKYKDFYDQYIYSENEKDFLKRLHSDFEQKDPWKKKNIQKMLARYPGSKQWISSGIYNLIILLRNELKLDLNEYYEICILLIKELYEKNLEKYISNIPGIFYDTKISKEKNKKYK